jgi:hypothetical protein
MFAEPCLVVTEHVKVTDRSKSNCIVTVGDCTVAWRTSCRSEAGWSRRLQSGCEMERAGRAQRKSVVPQWHSLTNQLLVSARLEGPNTASRCAPAIARRVIKSGALQASTNRSVAQQLLRFGLARGPNLSSQVIPIEDYQTLGRYAIFCRLSSSTIATGQQRAAYRLQRYPAHLPSGAQRAAC